MTVAVRVPEISVARERTAAANRVRLPAALLVGVCILAAALLAMGPWPAGVFYDDAIYLILAKALATGEGYRYLNLPGSPAATHYPPGYPAVLALLWRVGPEFPGNLPLLKAANAVFFAAAGAGLYRLATLRAGLAPLAAAAAVMASLLAIPVLAMAGVLFSEPLFLALLIPALIASERLLDRDTRHGDALLVGVLCGLATLVRSIGIAAIAGVLIVLLLRRRSAAAATVAAAAGMVLLPWLLWSAAHTSEVPAILEGSYGSYAGWLLDAFRERGPGFGLEVATKNLGELLRPATVLFTPRADGWLRLLLLVPLAVVLGAGFFRLARRAPMVAAFLACYMGIVLLWPYTPDRFLWGIWPFVGVVVALGVAAAWEWRPEAREQRAARLVLLAFVALSLAVYTRYNVRGYAKGWHTSAQRGAAGTLRPVVNWVAANTNTADVIASDGDPLVYLYTGRRAVPAMSWTAAEYLRPQSSEEQLANTRALLATFEVDYLIVPRANASTAPAAERLLTMKPPRLSLVDTLPGTGAVFTPIAP